MKEVHIKNVLLLLLTATIWGVAFVAQSVGNDYVEPFTFNASRFIIGGFVLVIYIAIRDRGDHKKKMQKEGKMERRTLLTGGIFCGICLFLASNFQQIGIQYTSAGKAGFITACYIVIVPVIGIFMKKKTNGWLWLAVAIAVVGLYFLCITESFSIGRGDILLFACALIFSVHILVIDHFSPLTDGVKLSCIQFFVSGILSGICMAFTEHPQMANILEAGVPILYAGVLSCGVAYTLQIVGQKNMNPTVASLILSLESCISVLAGWLILGEALSGRELFGCVLMFAAIILAQIPGSEKKRAG